MCRFNGQAVERTHSITNPLNLYIQWLSTFNTTYIYRIFCNKRPLPINRPPPPLFSTFAKFIFRGFTSLSTANTFAIPGFRKMVHFSTSQANIAYEK